MDSLNIDLFILCMEANSEGHDIQYTYDKRMSSLYIVKGTEKPILILMFTETQFKNGINEVKNLIANKNK